MTTIPSPSAASSGQALWGRVLTLYAHVERELARTLQRKHGMGLSGFRALECLVRAEGGELRVQELADKVGLGQSPVTRLVCRLFSAEGV